MLLNKLKWHNCGLFVWHKDYQRTSFVFVPAYLWRKIKCLLINCEPGHIMTGISTHALYNPYFNLQTTSQFPQHFHSLGYTSFMFIELLTCCKFKLSLSRIEAMRRALWSAESEARHSEEHYAPLKTRLYHRAKHCGPLKARLKTWQNLKFS